MIQTAVSTLSVDHSKVAGKAHGASAKASEAGSFSAILGDSDGAATASTDTSDVPAAEAAVLAQPVAVGKPGKATGKNLPVAAKDKADKAKPDADTDAETDSDPSEAEMTAASVPFTLAGMQPLPLPPLSGTTPVTNGSRAADSGTATTITAASRTLPEVATAAAVGVPQSSASDHALAVLGLVQGALPAATAQTTATAKTTTTSDAATVSADAQALAGIKLAPVQIVPDAAPATAAQLAARMTPASAVQIAAAAPAQKSSAARPTTASSAQTPAGAQIAAATPAQTPTTAQLVAAGQSAPVLGSPVINGKVRATDRQQAVASTELAAETEAPVAKADIAAAAPAHASPIPFVADAAQPQTAATPASSSVQGTSSVQGPQDFGTLVSRLNEAREAASPQLVRTAISHSEFGQISLQFRHEDNGLSVTMANSDPAFAGAVQAAASASLAGGSNGNSDNASQNQQQQQQQHASASSQQQAAAGGAGAGGGNGQNSQARADQAGQSMNRGQGTASRPQDQDASASSQDRDGTRRGGGIYA